MALAGSSQGQVALLQRQVSFCADGWKEVLCNHVACPQGHVNCAVSSISSASWAPRIGHGHSLLMCTPSIEMLCARKLPALETSTAAPDFTLAHAPGAAVTSAPESCPWDVQEDAWQLLGSCALDQAVTWAMYCPDAAKGLVCTASATLW